MADFKRTRDALRVWDEDRPRRDAVWEFGEIGDATAADDEAAALVHLAFHEDTKTFNSLEQCQLVHPDDPWLRNLVNEKPFLPATFAKCLMSDGTSKPNKLWLIAGWCRQYVFHWKWQGAPGTSRMMFSFEGGPFKPARSYEEDIYPTLKWAGEQ